MKRSLLILALFGAAMVSAQEAGEVAVDEELVVVTPKTVKTVKYATKKESEIDLSPTHWIFSSAIVGFAVWGWAMFAYVGSGNTDTAVEVLPIAWLWNKLTNETYGWMAASLLCMFFFYAIIDVPMLVGYFLMNSGFDATFLAFWSLYFGMWVSAVLKMFPWIFALASVIHIKYNNDGFANSIVLLVLGLFTWIYSFVINGIFAV